MTASRTRRPPPHVRPTWAGRPMERTGGMENAHETMAADWATVQARFPHRLGRLRTPPVRSTGKIVVLFEHDVTGGISNTRCEADERKLTDERSLCSDEPFTFAGFRVHDPRIRRSTSPECAMTTSSARKAGEPGSLAGDALRLVLPRLRPADRGARQRSTSRSPPVQCWRQRRSSDSFSTSP